MSNNAETMKKSKRTLMPKLRFPEFRNKPGWKTFRFIDLADPNVRWSFIGGPFGSNLKSSDYTPEGVRIIQLQNIGDGEFLDKYKIYTSPSKADELLSCNAYPEEIILSKMGDPVGRACITPTSDSRYLMCSDGIRLVVDEDRFDKLFVFLSINFEIFRQRVESAATGSTRKRIGLDTLRQLPLEIPDRPEQQKIANCLGSLDGLIAAEARKLAALRDHKRGLLQQLFPLPGQTQPRLRFPEFRGQPEWKQRSLVKLADELRDGDWIESKDQSNEGIRIVQTGNVGEGVFIHKSGNARYISSDTFERLNCREVFPGDCLVSRLPDPIGRCCLVPDIGCRMVTAVDCAIIRFDSSSMLPYFFVNYSQTSKYLEEADTMGSGSTRKRISRDNLSRIKVPFPDLKEQQKIAGCLSALDDRITAQAAKVDALKQHKRGLMQQLFPAQEEQ